MKRLWTGRSRGGALGHLLILGALRLCGRRVAYALVYVVTLYFMLAARKAARASRRFLDAAMGPAPGVWASFWRSRRHLQSFAECLIDRACMQAPDRYGLTWQEEGDQHLRQGRGGVIVLSAHIGNYEMAGAVLHGKGVPVNVVMLDAESASIKAVHQCLGGDSMRPRTIAINQGAFPSLEILAALRRGEIVAMHGDRVVDRHHVSCRFLGRSAFFSTAPFVIAATVHVPLVLAVAVKEGRSHYRIVVEPPRVIELSRDARDEALAMHVRWYVSRLEHYASAYPLQWYNFYDFWGDAAGASVSPSQAKRAGAYPTSGSRPGTWR